MSESSIRALTELVVMALVPTTHAMLAIVFLASTRITPLARRLGFEFLVIAIANGLMWFPLMRLRLPRSFDMGRELCDVLVGSLGFLQFVCYVMIAVGFVRLLGDMRARLIVRFDSEDGATPDDEDSRPWQNR